MAVYDLVIESGKEKITLDNTLGNESEESIQEVVFKMNSINDNTLNRDKSVRCEMIIKGMITDANKEETLKLAKWAKENSSDELIYRNVEVSVYKNERGEELLRKYSLAKMFCIDYQEKFSDEGEGDRSDTGYFELYIAQKEGRHVKDIFAD